MPLGPSECRGAIGLLIAFVLALAGASSAAADPITIDSCHDAAGEAVGHDGWSNFRTTDGDMYATDTCAAGGAGALSLELAGNGGGYPSEARTEWLFSAPPWGRIVSYRLALADSYAMPWAGAGEGQAFVEASDESDPIYDYRNLADGSLGAQIISRTPPSPDSSITVDASCDGLDGACPAGPRIARIDLASSEVTLNDPTSPTVGGLSGSLLPGATARGTAETDFDASDSGPGIYSAQLTVDGMTQPPVLLDSNEGWCRDLTPSAAIRSFAHPDPCLASLSGAVSLDTTKLADGEHTVRLTVDDASGNTTTAFSGAIKTDNAPVETVAPAITPGGVVTVGAVLSASPGAWSAPGGAGAITYGYQWQDCTSRGEECEAIPGARASSYTTTAADAAHTVRVLVSAGDADGQSSAASAVSATLAAPPGASGGLLVAPGTPNGRGASETAAIHIEQGTSRSRDYRQSAMTLTGSLTGAQGQPIPGAELDVIESSGAAKRVIGHAVTAVSGSFSVYVPAGASRTIQIAYRAFSSDPGYAASGSLRERVSAGVQFTVTPQRTTPGGRITLAGRVLGGVPRSGVIVELMVRYHGQWEPFRTPRTDASGRFRVRYQFQGATGRFPFRAAVPGGQAGFAYAAGSSPMRTVATG